MYEVIVNAYARAVVNVPVYMYENKHVNTKNI